MDTNSPILSDPDSHARLRGLIADMDFNRQFRTRDGREGW
jgi:hypothetical protein